MIRLTYASTASHDLTAEELFNPVKQLAYDRVKAISLTSNSF